MTSLRQDVDAFAAARRVQISGWADSIRPTLSDAVQELRDRTVSTGRHAITEASVVAKEIGGTAADVGQAVAGRAGALGRGARNKAASLMHGKLQRARDQTEDHE